MQVPEVIDLLSASDRNIRSAAAGALCEAADIRSAEALCGALADSDRGVRSLAARALGRVLRFNPSKSLTNECLSRLYPALYDMSNERFVRIVAAQAMGRTCSADAAYALCNTLGDFDMGVYSAAADSLAELGDVCILALCSTIQSSNSTVHIRAEMTLARIRRSTPQLALRILKSTRLTSEQMIDTFSALKSIPRVFSENFLPDVPSDLRQFCLSLCRKKDTNYSVRRGAESVLAELERRANAITLLRASQQDGVGANDLLRASLCEHSDMDPSEMVRAADGS
jgi:HEAT repeat protein